MAKENLSTDEPVQQSTGQIAKFTIEKLRENCQRLFGVSISTFDGATHGMSSTHTVEQIKSTIEKWGAKEVK